ncbi:TVP38/TMEM64 family protein [Shouchella miscanthi]|uniref:TVP38/TMEM64 family membrane protein n=1 Tax=Shouchella miscanthi TaxID=2598861 RepID=A0ABU6NMF8_9BACI|nr:VTT domain-containing protein [Shouchella miscanthi]
MIIKVATAILIILSIVLVAQSSWVSELRTGEGLETSELFQQSLPFLLSLSFVLLLVQSILTVIPLALILIFNYLLLGFWLAYAWSLGTSIIASLLSFCLYRYWLQHVFQQKVRKNWVQAIEKNGFWVVLTSRLVPVMPSSLINVAAGSSRITVKTFLFATFIGNGLYLMALFLLMEGFIAGGTEWFLLIGVVLLFCTIAVKKKWTKRMKSGVNEQ